jgi:hypothetical protein
MQANYVSQAYANYAATLQGLGQSEAFFPLTLAECVPSAVLPAAASQLQL